MLESMTFHAMMESGTDTKTAIGGEIGDAVRYLMWLPEDSIGVYNSKDKKLEPFVNINTEESVSASFEGKNAVQETYYAVYPYSKSHSYASTTMTIDLPVVQHYVENSFGNKANPMVAYAESGKDLYFQNLCGVLVINLTGSVTVKSMSLTLLDESGNPAPLSGKHTVSMDYIESPSLKSTDESKKTVTLDCGEGVVLNSAEPTPFHLVVPAGTYSGVTLSVVTDDGQLMVKQGKNSLRIRRTRISSAGALEFQSEIAVDLSERGTSNCYVVSEPGVYSFDATVIGNGEFGLVPDAGFHTDDVRISPATVELLWEDKPCVVQALFLYDGKIGFYSSGTEGNALIAAKDDSGNILWSWHIWVTSELSEQTYTSIEGVSYVVLDRNLAAVDDCADTDYDESVGVYFQWGRKDPLNLNCLSVNKENAEFSILESIKKPIVMSSNNFNDYQSSERNWMNPLNDKLWLQNQKTIYDPCPVGYTVASPSVFTALTGVPEKSDDVYTFRLEGTEYAFPYSYFYNGRGTKDESAPNSYVWTSVYGKTLMVSEESASIFDRFKSSPAVPVRCMKYDGYVDVSLPQVEIAGIEEKTETSAKIILNIKSAGISDIIDKGVIFGTSEDLSDGVKISCGNGEDYSCVLTGLDSATIYFVKAYAVNARGESHSEVCMFYTAYSESDVVDLSTEGTANCYIVSEPGLYAIDCMVKGNSSESIGIPASASVVWETRNTDMSVSTGEVITSVELHGGSLLFEIPYPFCPGNALVAVEDESGNILWSWHIWVSDYDPELTAQTYVSGAVMMDRNLGALDAGKTSTAYGFLYQWGRKDPFVTSATGSSDFAVTAPADLKAFIDHVDGDVLEYSILHPTHVIRNIADEDIYWDKEKTMHDPCPNGWRVPDGGPSGVWSGIVWEGISKGSENGSVFWIIGEQYSTPAAVYPAPGYTGGSQLALSFPGSALYCWSCTSINSADAYGMHLFNRIERELSSGKGSEFSVRCMKE